MKKKKLYFDKSKCSACGACALACMDQNDVDIPAGEHPFRYTHTLEPVSYTHLEVVTALKERCDHGVFGYANPLPRTFEAIQGWWERRFGWKPETSSRFLSCGVVTGIYFALEALVPKGGKVLAFTPVYDPFFAAIRNSGHTLVECPLNYEDDYYTIDYERFEAELKHGVEAVTFCNPHNPVGRVWTEEELKRVVDLCVKYHVYLLSLIHI